MCNKESRLANQICQTVREKKKKKIAFGGTLFGCTTTVKSSVLSNLLENSKYNDNKIFKLKEKSPLKLFTFHFRKMSFGNVFEFQHVSRY